MFVFHEFVLDGLFGVGGPRAQLRQAVDHVGEEMESVQVVQDDHVEGRRGGAFLFVAAHGSVRLNNRHLHAALDDARADGVAGQAGGVVDVQL